MGILLILAQVALVVLDCGSHTLALSPWIVFLPAILFGTLWLIASMTGTTFVIDRIKPFASRQRRR